VNISINLANTVVRWGIPTEKIAGKTAPVTTTIKPLNFRNTVLRTYAVAKI